MNEDWSTLFVQALQNSLASAKADNKWNQELAFRKEEFEEGKRRWLKESENDAKRLDLQAQGLNNSFLDRFTRLEGDALDDWKANWASLFGMPIDNPNTPEPDYYVPTIQSNNRYDLFTREQARIDKFFNENRTEVPTYTYKEATDYANSGKRAGSTFDSTYAKKFNMKNVPDPNQTYYNEAALRGASEIDYKMKDSAAERALRKAIADGQLALGYKQIEDSKKSNFEVSYTDKSGKKQRAYVTNMTPEQVYAKFGDNVLIRAITGDQAFSGALYQQNMDSFNPDSIKSTADARKMMEEMIRLGINPSQVSEFAIPTLNKVEEFGRNEYSKKPYLNLLGQALLSPPMLVGKPREAMFLINALPRDWTTVGFNEAVNTGRAPSDYDAAVMFLNGMPALGATPNTILRKQ